MKVAKTSNPLSSSTSGARHFGTILSGNSSQPHKNNEKEASTLSKQPNPTSSNNQYTVAFGEGPIGIELERGTLLQSGMPCCRVQRFVDGGPSNPGPARASGCIHPGDVVVAVNGSPVTTYDETIAVLQNKAIKREMTFQIATSEYHNVPNTNSKRLPGTLRKKIIRLSSFDLEDSLSANDASDSISGSLRKSKSEQSMQKLRGHSNTSGDLNDIISPRMLMHRAYDSAATPLMNSTSDNKAGSNQQAVEQSPVQYSPLLMSPSLTSIALASTKKPYRHETARSIKAGHSKEGLHTAQRSSDLNKAQQSQNEAAGKEAETSEEIVSFPPDTNDKENQSGLNSDLFESAWKELEKWKLQLASEHSFSSLEGDKNKLQASFLKLQMDYAAIEEKNRMLQQHTETNSRETKELKEELQKTVNEQKTLQHDLEKAQSQVENYESEIADEATVNEAIRGKLEYATKRLETEREKHEREMQEEQRRFSEVSLLLLTTQQKLHMVEEQSTKEKNGVTSQLKEERETFQDTRRELEKTKEKLNDTEKALETATGRIESLTYKLENGKELYLEKCKRLEETMQEVESLQSQQDGQTNEAQDHEQKLHRETRDALENAKADLKALEQKLEGQKAEVRQISTKLHQKEAEIVQIETSHNTEKTSILCELAEERSLSSNLQETAQISSSTIDSLKKENESLRGEIARSTDSFDSKTAALQITVQKLEQELLQSEDRHKELEYNSQVEKEILESRIEQADSEIHSLRAENENLTKETLRLKETVQILEKDNESFQTQLADALQSATEQNGDAGEEKLQDLINQIEVLEDERNQAKLEKEEIMRALVEKTEDSVVHTKEMSNALREAHTHSKEVEDTLIQRSVELQTELVEKEIQLKASQEELEALRQMLSHREDTFSNISGIKTHEASITGIDASFAAESQLVDMRTELKVLERKIRSLEATNSLLKRQNEDLTKMKEDFYRNIRVLKDKAEQKDARLMKLSTETELLQTRLEEAKEESLQNEEQAKRSSILCEIANRKNDEMKSKMREFVERARKEEEEYMRELIATQDELSKVNQAKIDSEKILRSMRRSLAESEGRATAAREKLTSERALTRQYMKKSEEERTKLLGRIEELKSEMKRIKDSSSGISAEKSALHTEVTTLMAHIQELENELLANQNETQSKIAALTAEKESLVQQSRQERDRCSNLADKLRESQGEVESISKELQSLNSHYEKELSLIKFNSDLHNKQRQNDLQEKASTEQALLQKETELGITQKEFQKTREVLEKANVEISHLNSQYAQVVEDATFEADQLHKKYSTEISALMEKNETLTREIVDSNASAEKMSHALDEKEREVQAVISRFNTLSEENQVLTRNLQANEASLSLLEDTVNQLREEYVDASQDETASFFGLPRAELRALAQELRDDLTRAEEELKQCMDELAAKQRVIDGLYDEREKTSSELNQILEMNSQLESRIQRNQCDKEESKGEIASLKLTQDTLVAQRDKLQEEMRTQVSINDALSSKLEQSLHDSQAASQQFEGTVQDLHSQIKTLNRRLNQLESENTKFEKEAFSQGEEILSKTKLIEEQSNKMKMLKSHHQNVESHLNVKIKQLEETLARKESSSAQIEAELNSVQEDFMESRKMIAEQEVNVQSISQKLQQAEARESRLLKQRDELEVSLNHQEKHREEAVDKLSEATALVVQQKKKIMNLEKDLKESNDTRATLFSQVTNLQGTIDKLEERSTKAGEESLAHSQEIAENLSELQKQFDSCNEEVSRLKDELSSQKRLLQQSERQNTTLRNRLDQLKKSLAASKESEKSLFEDKENILSQLKDLQYAVEGKQRDVDHLTSRNQVLTAQNSRLKSNQLLQEQKTSPARSGVDSKTLSEADSDLRALKSQLETQSIKIQALLESHREQHLSLSHYQSQSTQLLRYCEDFIAFVTDTCCELQNTLGDQPNGDKSVWKSLQYLDLAAQSRNAQEIDLFLSEFSDRLVQAAEDLDNWKQRRGAIDSTQAKDQSSNTDLLNASLDTMKQMIEEEFLTPLKNRSAHNSSRFDAEYLQEVIHSLDSQIDGLLTDLRTANESLKVKDKLFADLEGLLSATESEKEKLEMKLNKILRARKESYVEEASDTEEENLCTEQASVMLGRFFEDLDQKRKASALRRWSCEASAQAAKEHQMSNAKRITSELESAQEKITILQRHMSRVQSPRSSPEYGLKRIEEALERSLASSPSEYKNQDS